MESDFESYSGDLLARQWEINWSSSEDITCYLSGGVIVIDGVETP